jgi:hypothetical protein
MRECLAAHLEFLNKGKAQLLAQKQELVRKHSTVSLDIDNDKTERFDANLGSSDSWFLLQDGLYLLRDRPSITRTPMMARLGDLKKSVAAYVWASPDQSDDMGSSQRTANIFSNDHHQPWPKVPATTPAKVNDGGESSSALLSLSSVPSVKKSSAGRKEPHRVINIWSHSLW